MAENSSGKDSGLVGSLTIGGGPTGSPAPPERTIDGLLNKEYEARFVKQVNYLLEGNYEDPVSAGMLDLVIRVEPDDLSGHHMFGEAFRRVRQQVGRKMEDGVRPRSGDPSYRKRFHPAILEVTVPELDFAIELTSPKGMQLLKVINDFNKDNPFPVSYFLYRLRDLPHDLCTRKWLEGSYKVSVRPIKTQEEMFPGEAPRSPDVEVISKRKEAAGGSG